MSYEKQTWEELPSENTPVNAERMNHIEEGIDSKLDKMSTVKMLGTAGWYRVAKISDDGQMAKSLIVNINTRYSNMGNMSASVLINIAYLKYKMCLLSSSIRSQAISKVRLVNDNNETYIEVYYNGSTQNIVGVDIINQKYNTAYETDVSMLNFEAPTSTATVLDELPIGEMTITNEYGTATKFPDGTMICRGKKTFELNTFTPWGQLYSSGSGNMKFNDFAVEFIDVPIVTLSAWNDHNWEVKGDYWLMSDTTNKPTAKNAGGFQCVRATNTTDFVAIVGYIAIGRWK